MAINSKLLVSAAISALAIVAVVTIFVLEDKPLTQSSTEQTINELEQSEKFAGNSLEFTGSDLTFYEKWCAEYDGVWRVNAPMNSGSCSFETKTKKEVARLSLDDIKNIKVTGENAQNICIILGMPCPNDAVFDAHFDPVSKTTTLSYIRYGGEYEFEIDDTVIKYKTPRQPEEWKTFDSNLFESPVILSVSTSKDYYFLGDELEISGMVHSYADDEIPSIKDAPVILQITSQEDDLVEVAQVQPSSDGQFTHVVQLMGLQWQQSGYYAIKTSFGTGNTERTVFKYFVDSSDISFVSQSSNYEDVCGYPITDKMRLDVISDTTFSHDSIPYLELHPGKFTHVKKSQYLTVVPILQYWFELDNGKQVYFEMEVCDLDASNITLGEIGPNYKEPEDIVIDGVAYQELAAPGHPLIHKDTLEPLLDVDNCRRVADGYTEEERWQLYTRETTTFDAPWKNQVFPLMDYCTNMGKYELITLDGNINWNYTLLE